MAKDFVKAFLTVNPNERMSPAVALKHPWIFNHSNQSNKNLVRYHTTKNFFKLIVF